MGERIEFFIRGGELLAEPYRYEASGLDNVYLLNGVTHKQTAYGDMVHIANIHGLHRAIGLHIVEKAEQVTGAEFRFLRKQLGLSQAELAKRMGVGEQTIANYEKEHTQALGPADPFIRMLYLVDVLPEETRAKVIKKMTEKPLHSKRPARLPEMPRRKMVGQWHEQEEPHMAA